MRSYQIFILLLAIGSLWSCTKDVPEPEPETVEIFSEEQAYTIDLQPEVLDNTLRFQNSQEFFDAMSLLDTVSLISRVAWEERLGFRSLRSVYEELVVKHINNDPFDKGRYEHLISFEGEVPKLIYHTEHAASVMNEDGEVYVGESVGSIRTEGCFWVYDGNKDKLKQLIESKETNEPEGMVFYDQRLLDQVQFRECHQGNPNSPFNMNGVAQNGDSNGSSRVASDLDYNFLLSGSNNPQGTVDVKVFFRLSGTSRRKRRNRWRTDRRTHKFQWNFQVDRIENNEVVQTYNESGLANHTGNITAAQEIVVVQGLFSAAQMAQTRFQLTEVFDDMTSSFATRHTTDRLDPISVIYGCN